MELRTKVGMGLGLVVTLAAFGCTARRSDEVVSTPATTERRAKPAKKAPAVEPETPAPAAKPVVAAPAPIDLPARETAFAPAFEAPALDVEELGNELGGDTCFSIDPLFAVMTFWERDVSIAGLPALRRAIWPIFDASKGLFGVGWRSEVEASLHRDGEAMILVDLHGVQHFAPADAGRWVSVLGPVRELEQTEDGYAVSDQGGRSLTFDREGRLTSIGGELTIERLPGALRLVAAAGVLTLELDPATGRVTRATGPGVELRYVYEAAWLAEVQGTTRRGYGFGVDATKTWFEVFGEKGTIACLTAVEGGRVTLELPGRLGQVAQRYTFADQGVVTDGPLGHAAFSVREPGVVRVEVGGKRYDTQVDDRFEPVEAATAEEAPAAPAGQVERDAKGQVSAVGLPGGERVRFVRDAAGRVVEEQGPAGRVTFERNAEGRVIRREDAAGTSISVVRDAAGRVESFSGAAGSEVAFEYDAAGRPTKIETEGHALMWRWDAQGRFEQEVGPDATLTYTRDATGEQVTTPWGAFARRTDATGQVTGLETPAGRFALARDGEGQLVRVRAPNGVVTEIARDAEGRESRRTTRGKDGTVLELSTTRDAAGKATRLVRDGATLELTRDAQGRLIGAKGAGLDLTYGWTAGGDRVDATQTLEHDAAGRLVRRVGPEGETRYGWSDLGRLVRVESVRAGKRSVVEYGYDGLGRLVRRTTAAGTTRYVHENGQVVAELGPGERVRVWIHGPGTDEPLAYGDGKDWTFLHGDATWTTLAYTDAKGARAGQAIVGPFGEVAQAAGDRPALFAGRAIDPETGLVNLRARWYLPALGRFLDADAIGVDGGSNPWLYCEGDPVETRDPMGFAPEADLSGIGPAVAPRGGVRVAGRKPTPQLLQAVAVAREALAHAGVADLDARLRDYQVALFQAGLIDAPTRERAEPASRAPSQPRRPATRRASDRQAPKVADLAVAPAAPADRPTFAFTHTEEEYEAMRGLAQLIDEDAELGRCRVLKSMDGFRTEEDDTREEQERRERAAAKAAARAERIRQATLVVEAAREAELSFGERLARKAKKFVKSAYDSINVPLQAGLSAYRSIQGDGFLGKGNAELAPSQSTVGYGVGLARRRGDYSPGGTHNADLNVLGETGQDVTMKLMGSAVQSAAAGMSTSRTLDGLERAKKGADLANKIVDKAESLSEPKQGTK